MSDELEKLKQQVESLQYRYDKYREHAVSRLGELEAEVERLKKEIEENKM